jgi:hypothetical protein
MQGAEVARGRRQGSAGGLGAGDVGRPPAGGMGGGVTHFGTVPLMRCHEIGMTSAP